MRDIDQKRLTHLQESAGSNAPIVRMFGGDLRALLEMEEALENMRPGLSIAKRAELIAATETLRSSSKVTISVTDLRALLEVREELQARRAAAEQAAAELAAAEVANGARSILSRANGNKVVVVGPNHGPQPSRTYGFDLAHLADFLGVHPETARQAIRERRLVPTDLRSIYEYKRAREARKP